MKTWSTFVAMLSLLILPVPSPANADALPVVTLVSPQAGAKITPDAPFKVILDITGGAASSANDCSFSTLDAEGNTAIPWFEMAELDANGQGKVWMQESFGTGLNIWQPKIIKNGVECSFTTFDTTGSRVPGNWNDISSNNQNEESLFGLNYQNPNQVGTITKLILSWGFGNPNDVTSAQKREFNAGPSAAPTFSFSGIKRGDSLNSIQNYTVDVTMGNSLTFAGGSDTSFKSSGLCGPAKANKSTSTTTYEKTCTINAAFDLTSDQTTFAVSAEVFTEQGGDYHSDPVVLNVVTTDFPIISFNQLSYFYGKNSKPGKGTTIELTAFGQVAVATPGDFQSPNVAGTKNIPLQLCISSSCESVAIDESGYFQIKKETLGTSMKWTLKGMYKDQSIASNSLYDISGGYQLDYANSDPIGDTGVIKPMPKPYVPPPIKIKIANVKAPSNVKWGHSFNLSVSAVGTGSAQCEARFQDTLTRGRTAFKLSAGKTTKVTVSPWIDIHVATPLTVVCVPNNWPNQTYLKFPITFFVGNIAIV